MSQANTLVSVLMPCYNAAGTLPEALASLFKQTLVDFEIVAVDDGSTDSTQEILMEWAQKDGRLSMFSQEHAGVIPALNRGLAVCRGEFISRMDSDDYSYPERLERQVYFLRAHPEIGVVSCRVTGFPEGEIREGFRLYLDWLNGLVDDEDIRREIFVESPLPHPSVTFRREVIEALGGYQEHGWPEDYDLWLRLYLVGARFARLPETLLGWRDHPQRLTRTDPRYSLENFLRLKAHYLMLGPLAERKEVIIWGAGMMGRRLSKQLARLGAPLIAFVDIDPRKIGNTRRGLPILPPEALPGIWAKANSPVILAAVGARGARSLIRQRFEAMGLREAMDWWFAA